MNIHSKLPCRDKVDLRRFLRLCTDNSTELRQRSCIPRTASSRLRCDCCGCCTSTWGARSAYDLSGDPQLRKDRQSGQRMGCCTKPVRYPIPRAVQQMTRQSRMGYPSNTEFRTFPTLAPHLRAPCMQGALKIIIYCYTLVQVLRSAYAADASETCSSFSVLGSFSFGTPPPSTPL